jgi:hypothetical protein
MFLKYLLKGSGFILTPMVDRREVSDPGYSVEFSRGECFIAETDELIDDGFDRPLLHAEAESYNTSRAFYGGVSSVS